MRRFLIAAAATLPVTAAADAGPYTWKSRPLYVFAPNAGDSKLAEQRAIAASAAAGFRERDIVVVYVIGDAVSAELGPVPGETAAALRSRYGVARDAFRAVLVGKDGGAKLSSKRALTAAALAATIDAMPMRREEIRRRG